MLDLAPGPHRQIADCREEPSVGNIGVADRYGRQAFLYLSLSRLEGIVETGIAGRVAAGDRDLAWGVWFGK